MKKFSEMDGYSQLAYMKSRTPFTADGEPIFTRSLVWNLFEGEAMQLQIIDIQYEPAEDDILLFAAEVLDHRYPIVYPCDCYSTREALEDASNEKI